MNTELDALLTKAVELGFKLYEFHTEMLAGVFQYSESADVFVFFDREHAHAYRLPTDSNTDIFAPTQVYWWYAASPVWTLRALLTLPDPHSPWPRSQC